MVLSDDEEDNSMLSDYDRPNFAGSNESKLMLVSTNEMVDELSSDNSVVAA